ncbi:hypothetical protein [Aureimonas psammosilenae]|uniref:hypothetical protein n=1 Tax=Aureimonas psammosilenae TaxID=2495496 RepID=UPI001260B441|nr:hypothetical protein [Aureimonas psammosilenae]
MQNPQTPTVIEEDATALLAACRRLAFIMDDATKALAKGETTALPVGIPDLQNLASSVQMLLHEMEHRKPHAFYVYDPEQPFNRRTATRFETIEDAGVEILGAGCDYGDLVQGCDDRFIPYRVTTERPVYFTSLSAATKEITLANVATSDRFPLRCATEAQAAALEAEQARPSLIRRALSALA